MVDDTSSTTAALVPDASIRCRSPGVELLRKASLAGRSGNARSYGLTGLANVSPRNFS